MSVSCTVSNRGFSDCKSALLGMVFLNAPPRGDSSSNFLTEHIRLEQNRNLTAPSGGQFAPAHIFTSISLINPFANQRIKLVEKLNINRFVESTMTGSKKMPYKWNAALYLIPQDSAPVWYQLSIDIDDTKIKHNNISFSFKEFITLEREVVKRPTVSISQIL